MEKGGPLFLVLVALAVAVAQCTGECVAWLLTSMAATWGVLSLMRNDQAAGQLGERCDGNLAGSCGRVMGGQKDAEGAE